MRAVYFHSEFLPTFRFEKREALREGLREGEGSLIGLIGLIVITFLSRMMNNKSKRERRESGRPMFCERKVRRRGVRR